MDERDDFKNRLHRKVLDRLDSAKLGQTPNAAGAWLLQSEQSEIQ
jgi:hypothetical protein